MHKMTPLRWLAATGAAAALYVMYLVASAHGREWPVPVHLNSVILWALGLVAVACVVVAAVNHRDDHSRDRDDRNQVRIDKLSYQLRRLHGDLAERLDVVDGRLAALEGPTQPIPAIVGAPAVYRSGAVVAEPDWSASDDEIRGFLARELLDPPDDDTAT